jgi:hypothetical protein
VVEVLIWSLSTTFLLDVGTVLTVGYFCSTNYYFRKVGDKLPVMIKKQVNRIISLERLFHDALFSYCLVLSKYIGDMPVFLHRSLLIKSH